MTVSDTAEPRVSVVIPTRGRPDLLCRAVESVLGQDYAGEIEAIVVFDREDVALPVVDPRPGRSLVGLPNGRAAGLSGARNTGIEAATGSLIAHCDDDDEWLPGKLARQVARLPGSEAALVAGALEIEYQGKRLRRSTAVQSVTHADFLTSRRMEVHSSALLVPQATYEAVGLLDENLPMSYAEDYDWLLRATQLGPVEYVEEPVVVIHWDRPSWFADRWSSMAEAYKMLIDKHPDLLSQRGNSARIYGQIAVASAASGSRREALSWAGQALRRRPLEARAYAAALMAAGLIRPNLLIHLAHRMGKGV